MALTWANGGVEKLVERVEYDAYGTATVRHWGPDRTFGTADDATSSASLVGNPFLFSPDVS